LAQPSPASLKIHVEGYRQVKIIKQRGGIQSATIPLPGNESLPIAHTEWSFIDQLDNSQSTPGYRPSA
jgi:hypothetical protein